MIEQLPGGITRTSATADSHIAGRMARAEYLHGRRVWMILIPVLLMGPLVIGVLKHDDFDGRLIVTMIVVDVVVTAFFVVALLFSAAPRYWRRSFPRGHR
jgi:uncharacterized membrane protein YhaH (DUF805 family)